MLKNDVQYNYNTSSRPNVPHPVLVAPTRPYRPDFFRPAEWSCLIAVCDGLLNDAPRALKAAEFIDRHMHTPYAHGHGATDEDVLPVPLHALSIRDQLRMGLSALDRNCQRYFDQPFADLPRSQQTHLLDGIRQQRLRLDASLVEWLDTLQTELDLACQSPEARHDSFSLALSA